MTEHLDIAKTSEKQEIYETLLPQIKALIEAEPDPVACMANVASALWMTFGHLWTGFYRAAGNQLILGPFQGPLACTRIKYGKGVCGTAWAEKRTLVVEDVEKFPGHIACSSDSKSEIVVPIMAEDGTVKGVIDIDSADLATFDTTDAKYLEKIASWLSPVI